MSKLLLSPPPSPPATFLPMLLEHTIIITLHAWKYTCDHTAHRERWNQRRPLLSLPLSPPLRTMWAPSQKEGLWPTLLTFMRAATRERFLWVEWHPLYQPRTECHSKSIHWSFVHIQTIIRITYVTLSHSLSFSFFLLPFLTLSFLLFLSSPTHSILPVPHPSACTLIDSSSSSVGLTVYNLAATTHFNIGDIVTLPDPHLKHVDFEEEVLKL